MLKNLLNKFHKKPVKEFKEDALMDTFARLPVTFVRGDGMQLWDDEDNCYLDALGGIAVTILGHNHPQISKAISLQASKLLHTSNLFHIKEQAALGEKFCDIAQMDKVFFCNSGAEANEAAIKIARKYGNTKDIKTPAIVTFNGSFHGRTMATLSATANANLQKGFEPMLADFIYADYNDPSSLAALEENTSIVAVMLEPIQGESGVIIPDEGYLRSIRALCDKHNWLLILDEIQTGMGRTGKWFAYQHEDVLPDIMTSAKALGNGIPIGACAARGYAATLLNQGSHGSTFGGNPFACKVALTTIETLENDNLLSNATDMGAYLKKQLQQKIGTHEKVVNIRGKGLMLAVELDQAYPNLAQQCLNHSLVINVTGGGKIIRMLPAAIIEQSHAKKIADTILAVISEL